MKVYFIIIVASALFFPLCAQMQDSELYTGNEIITRGNNSFSVQYEKYPEILNGLTEAMQLQKEGKTERAFRLLINLEDKSRKSGFRHGICDIELLKGEINYNWGMFDLALKHFLAAKKLAISLNYSTSHATALNYIGKYYHSKGNFKRSLMFLNKGAEIAEKTSDSAITSELYRNIGNYYNTIGSHSYALEMMFKSLSFLNEVQDPLNYASSCNHIGNVYQDQGNLTKALYYHSKALELRMSVNNKDETGKSLKNLGEVYEDMELPDSAIVLYNQAHELFRTTGYKKGMIKIFNNLGRIYVQKGHYEQGINHLKDALKLSNESGYSKGIMNAHYELGNCYRILGQEINSGLHYKIALEESKNHGIKELEREIYHTFYEIYHEKEDHKSALNYFRLYAAVNDSIRDRQHLARIDELAIKYETRVKEQENQFLKSQNELQETAISRKNIIIWVSLFSIASLLFAVYSVYVNLRNKKKDNTVLSSLNNQLQQLNNELNEANAEKDKLYSVFVHELRNPLLWFRNLTRMLNKNYDQMERDKIKKSLESLDESATQSYHLMDNLLQWTRSQLGKMKINPEVFVLENLVRENIKFTRNTLNFRDIKIDFRGEEHYIRADRVMVNTVIRNLLSNALKFTPPGGKILIETKTAANRVILTVSDTGIGITPKDQKKIFQPENRFTKAGIMKEKGSGIGLLLCKEFIERNDGNIHFTSEENKGSVFTIELPLYSRTKKETTGKKFGKSMA